MAAAPDVENYYKLILELPRVVGFIIMSLDGTPIKTTLEPIETRKYIGFVTPLIPKAQKAIRALVIDEEENVNDDITFIRVRSAKYEVLIAPDNQYVMIVVQDPHEPRECCEDIVVGEEGALGGEGAPPPAAKEDD